MDILSEISDVLHDGHIINNLTMEQEENIKKKTEDVVWVERNLTLLNYYINCRFEGYTYEHKEFIYAKFTDWNNCKMTRTILEDFDKSDKIKYTSFLKSLIGESLVVSIIAARGAGKTSFGVRLLEDIYKYSNKKIYALFPFPNLPFVNIIYDIRDAEENSVLYIDEVGMKYKARESNKEGGIALTNELIGLRHKHITVIGATQDLSLIDINFVRFSDVNVWKFYNTENESVTREGFLNDLMRELMPKENEIQKVLINRKGTVSTFSFEFSDWSLKTSHYLKDLISQKKEIIEYLSKYEDGKTMISKLSTEFGFLLTKQEKKEILSKYV